VIFNAAERAYLLDQFLGRLATIGSDGTPQVRPLGFRLNADDTLDLGGPRVARTRRYRNVLSRPRVSFVVDDMTPDDPADPRAVKPGMGRGIEVRGRAEAVTVTDPPGPPELAGPVVLRIHPERVVSWHVDAADPAGSSRDIG
jgi:pyridoxamine 5'-phosphate oxidase family protein